MGTATHDYDTLEKEYLGSNISIRALCKKHDIKSYSSVAQYAREHNWYERRDHIRNRSSEKTVEKLSERLSEEEVNEIVQFRNDSLTIVRAALYKFADNLQDPSYKIRADELVKLIQVGLLIVGQPTERIEERRLDLHASLDGLPDDVVRQLIDATRPRPVAGGAEAGALRTIASETRAN